MVSVGRPVASWLLRWDSPPVGSQTGTGSSGRREPPKSESRPPRIRWGDANPDLPADARDWRSDVHHLRPTGRTRIHNPLPVGPRHHRALRNPGRDYHRCTGRTGYLRPGPDRLRQDPGLRHSAGGHRGTGRAPSAAGPRPGSHPGVGRADLHRAPDLRRKGPDRRRVRRRRLRTTAQGAARRGRDPRRLSRTPGGPAQPGSPEARRGRPGGPGRGRSHGRHGIHAGGTPTPGQDLRPAPDGAVLSHVGRRRRQADPGPPERSRPPRGGR